MVIELNMGMRTIIDDEDWDRELSTTASGELVITKICNHIWKAYCNYNGRCYVKTSVLLPSGRRRSLFLHRLILGIPDNNKMQSDHINRDSLDNRKSNLRWATYKQNRLNCKKKTNGSSKYVGVYWHKPKKRWRAVLYIKGIRTYLGAFRNEIDAAKKADEVRSKLYGNEIYNINIETTGTKK